MRAIRDLVEVSDADRCARRRSRASVETGMPRVWASRVRAASSSSLRRAWRVLARLCPRVIGEPGLILASGFCSVAAASVRRRHFGLAAATYVVACAVVAGLLCSTHEIGGVDAARYCANLPVPAMFEHGDTYDSLRCVTGAGVVRVLDVEDLCSLDHPSWGFFGGAQFAGHVGTGWADWRCYGS